MTKKNKSKWETNIKAKSENQRNFLKCISYIMSPAVDIKYK